jgi:hypothetical protein
MAKMIIGFWLVFTIFFTTLGFGQTSQSSALRFTADGQYVLIPHTEELDMISGGITIEAWVKPEVGILSRGYDSIISKQLNGTGYMLATNIASPDERFKAEVDGIQVTSRAQPAIDGWQHVAAVWDGQLKIYVNGQLDGVINTGPPLPNSFPLWIGSSPFGADTNWRGAIDEVRIWAISRTQTQIQSTMERYLCGNEVGLRAYWSIDERQGQELTDTVGRSNGIISGPEWVAGVELVKPQRCPEVVNQLVQLDSLETAFIPPSVPPQPEAPGGIFSILANFSNISSSNICNPFFRVVELSGGNHVEGVWIDPGGGQIQGLVGEIVHHPTTVFASKKSIQFRFNIALQDRVTFVWAPDDGSLSSGSLTIDAPVSGGFSVPQTAVTSYEFSFSPGLSVNLDNAQRLIAIDGEGQIIPIVSSEGTSLDSGIFDLRLIQVPGVDVFNTFLTGADVSQYDPARQNIVVRGNWKRSSAFNFFVNMWGTPDALVTPCL